MRKKSHHYFYLALCLLAVSIFAGCDGSDDPPLPPPPVGTDLAVEADIAPIQTRASWDKTTGKAAWAGTDAIGVFVGANSNKKLTLDQSGKFTGKLDSEPAATADYYGYYPYTDVANIDGKVVTVTVPATQHYDPNGFAAAPMVAAYNGSISEAQMTFQHVFSTLKVSATLKSGLASTTVSSVRLSGNRSETLAGVAAIDLSGVSNTMSASTPIAVSFASGAPQSLTLTCGSGVAVTDASPTDFYVTIPAGDYVDGVELTFTTPDGDITVAHLDAVAAQRACIHSIQVELGEASESKWNIPDPVFRQYLIDSQYIQVDENDEIVAVYNFPNISMRIYGSNYPDIVSFKGLEYFTECTNLDYDSPAGKLEYMNVTALTKLKRLQVVYQPSLKSLDVTKCRDLKELWLVGCGITSLDVSDLPELTVMSIGGLPISTLDVSRLPKLEVLNMDKCVNMSSINLTNNPTLISLTTAGTKISSLDMSQNPNMRYIDVRDTDIAALNVSNMDRLYSLFIARTKIKKMDVSGKAELNEILLPGAAELEYLDISGCNTLQNIAMTGASGVAWSLMQSSGTALDFSLVDFSYYPKFKTLIVDDLKSNVNITDFICKNSTLESISLQNSTGISKIVVQNNPQLGTLYVYGLDLGSMNVTVTGNKTENIMITTPRE